MSIGDESVLLVSHARGGPVEKYPKPARSKILQSSLMVSDVDMRTGRLGGKLRYTYYVMMKIDGNHFAYSKHGGGNRQRLIYGIYVK